MYSLANYLLSIAPIWHGKEWSLLLDTFSLNKCVRNPTAAGSDFNWLFDTSYNKRTPTSILCLKYYFSAYAFVQVTFVHNVIT